MKFEIKKDGKRIIVICLAAVIMSLNIKSFVRTGGLYPGGVTGLTILIQTAAMRFFQIELPYTLINLLLNMLPIYIGFRFIGKKFTLYSCLMIVLSGILTDLSPGQVITYDPLLISIFGGMVSGLAVSMCLLVNATTGGTDFIAIYFSEKKGMDSWNLVLGLNIIILSAAGLMFGWDRALYSIIFQYVSTQVLHLLYQKYQKKTLFIVTNREKEVCQAINNTSKHGSTVLDGQGAYGNCERKIVYSVVASTECKKVLHAVRQVDQQAFINIVRTDQLEGRFYQNPTE